MLTLQCSEPRRLAYREQMNPELRELHAIISVKRIGICGTDLHAYEGTQPFMSYPRILGHELSGELIAFDGAPGFKQNEHVTFIPYFSCGNCIACRNGTPNCCVRIQVCGVHIDGGMAEYVLVPSHSLIHGDGLTLDELALVEPLAIGAHGVRRANVAPGEFVLVIGAGPIGLGAMEFARMAGGQVIAMDISDQRLRFCGEKLSIQHTINPRSSDAWEAINDLTGGDMPTVLIDATGNRNAINDGFQFMAHGARYVLIGLQRDAIVFSHSEFHKREGTLMSSRNATRQDFDFVIQSIKRGAIKPATFVTHHTRLNQAASEFEHWLKPENNVIKAMITV